MDKVIEEEVKARTRKKTIIVATLVISILIAVTWLIRSSLASSIKKSSVVTAIVGRGDVDNTINATGEVQPEFEETITSPINASVQKVMLNAGSKVKAGESVLTLDKTASQNDLVKLNFQLESKRNDVKKLKLQLDKSYYDLQSSNNIKQLMINSLEADVESAKRLLKAGGGTREDVEKAELNLKVAKLEKQQLENEIKSKQQSMQVEMKEATIAADIQGSDLQALNRKLQLASIIASRDGVVTWVNKNIGAAVREGDALARIADLGSFKIQGSISDSYLGQLHRNMAAVIRIGDMEIRGSVINIQPAVQNSIVTFDIQLDDPGNKLLRPNMKVDVYLVTASQNNVLRVANGQAFKGSGAQYVFVLKNGMAEKRKITVGMTNFDYVELTGDIKQGEEVITTDMSDYKNAKTVKVIN